MRMKMNGTTVFYVGLLFLIIGTGLMNWGTHLKSKEDVKVLKSTISANDEEIGKLNQELLSLKNGNKELIDGKNALLLQNRELTNKIEKYQEDLSEKQKLIEKLEIKSKKAERGITSIYEFNGIKRETTKPGHINVEYGNETEIFKKVSELERSRKYSELITLCETQINETPSWLTPYLYLGIAYANTGNKKKAIELFQHIVKNAPDDPDYKQAKEFLEKLSK